MRIFVTASLFALTLWAPSARASAQDAAGNPCTQTPVTTQLAFNLYEGRLSPESEALVDRLAAVLRACPDAHFELQVHTDTVRLTSFNRRASQQVAVQIRDRLVQHGVAAARLAPCGYGESTPLPNVRPSMRGNRNERLVLKRIDDAAAHRCPA
ncbi:MAG: OmpA family protein [Sandaracinaceae bacterium]